MGRSIVITNTPKCCGECDLVGVDCSGPYCIPADRYFGEKDSMEEKCDWCPRRDVPERKNEEFGQTIINAARAEGWNACLDAITGEAQE